MSSAKSIEAGMAASRIPLAGQKARGKHRQNFAFIKDRLHESPLPAEALQVPVIRLTGFLIVMIRRAKLFGFCAHPPETLCTPGMPPSPALRVRCAASFPDIRHRTERYGHWSGLSPASCRRQRRVLLSMAQRFPRICPQ